MSKSFKSTYVPGTHVAIPSKLLSYREEYQQVGRTVYVKIKQKVTLAKLKDDNRSMATVANKYPGKTFGQIVTQIMGNTLRKADPVEIEDYRTRKAACDDFIAVIKKREVARRAARDREQVLSATRVLNRMGLSVELTSNKTKAPVQL